MYLSGKVRANPDYLKRVNPEHMNHIYLFFINCPFLLKLVQWNMHTNLGHKDERTLINYSCLKLASKTGVA